MVALWGDNDLLLIYFHACAWGYLPRKLVMVFCPLGLTISKYLTSHIPYTWHLRRLPDERTKNSPCFWDITWELRDIYSHYLYHRTRPHSTSPSSPFQTQVVAEPLPSPEINSLKSVYKKIWLPYNVWAKILFCKRVQSLPCF